MSHLVMVHIQTVLKYLQIREIIVKINQKKSTISVNTN